MDNNNTILINNDELNALREQMAQLKQRLDSTTTLNEKLMVDAIKSKMRGIRNTICLLLFIGLLAIPMWLWIGVEYNLSWHLIVFTIVMLMGSATADYLINHIDIGLVDRDMAEAARQLVRMKKLRLRNEVIGIIVFTAWLVWVVWEFMHAFEDQFMTICMVSGILLGAVIGGIVGIRIFLKLRRDNDDMLRQINELQKEPE